MTDKELLELTAKAACGRLVKSVLRDEDGNECYEFRTDTSTEIWNPLTNDGDALRLAVKLGFKIIRWARDGSANGNVAVYKDQHSAAPLNFELIGNDPCAATRRAIVRAAAEIGKEMK